MSPCGAYFEKQLAAANQFPQKQPEKNPQLCATAGFLLLEQ
jgi:hypothetical protein